MDDHPAYLYKPVLLLRVQFWQSSRPIALPAIQARGHWVHLKLFGASFRRRFNEPANAAFESGRRHVRRALLAIGFRHYPGNGEPPRSDPLLIQAEGCSRSIE